MSIQLLSWLLTQALFFLSDSIVNEFFSHFIAIELALSLVPTVWFWPNLVHCVANHKISVTVPWKWYSVSMLPVL